MRTPPPLFEDVRFEREGWNVLLKLSSLVEMFESFNQVSVIVTIFRLFCVILKNRSNSLFLIDRELKVPAFIGFGEGTRLLIGLGLGELIGGSG
jgi:hypothetical protein